MTEVEPPYFPPPATWAGRWWGRCFLCRAAFEATQDELVALAGLPYRVGRCPHCDVNVSMYPDKGRVRWLLASLGLFPW